MFNQKPNSAVTKNMGHLPTDLRSEAGLLSVLPTGSTDTGQPRSSIGHWNK